MLLRHTLLYLPAQVVGPLFQLIAMIVWTHVVDEHTLGVITLVTATHELLQIGFLAVVVAICAALPRPTTRTATTHARFYRTENAVLLASVTFQSIAVVGFCSWSSRPDARSPAFSPRPPPM